MSTPFFSVIIPTYKDWPLVFKCLDALDNQSIDFQLFEIFVIDNDLTSNPPLFSFKNITPIILHEPKIGSYAARNKGIEKSTGKYFAFTDSDCLPDTDWLNNAHSYLSNIHDDELVRIAGNIEVFGTSLFTKAHDTVFCFKQAENALKGYGVTANLIAHRDLFLKVGLFNDHLKSGGDFEWGERARQIGIPIKFLENVRVYHPSRTFIDLIKKEKRTVGGAFDRLPSFSARFKYLLSIFRPPFKWYLQILKSKKISPVEKMLGLFTLSSVRITAIIELILLLMGKKSVRS